jgi:hypothetical protein
MAWDLKEITEDERDQVVSMGLRYLLQHLGASMIQAEAKADADRDFLEKVPNDRIAQA